MVEEKEGEVKANSALVPPKTEFPIQEEFLTAARKGDFDTVKDCIKRNKDILDAQDNDTYFTAEQKEWRSQKGRIDNSELDRKHIDNSALHFAAFGYDDDKGDALGQKMIEFVWQNGGNLDLKNTFGSTALHVAAAAGNTAAMSILLDKGADFLTNKIGNTPLHCAAYAAGAKEAKDSNRSPVECINFLLDYLRSSNQSVSDKIAEPNGVGMSAIDYAILSGNKEVENLLIDQANGRADASSGGVGLSDNKRADAAEGDANGDASGGNKI